MPQYVQLGPSNLFPRVGMSPLTRPRKVFRCEPCNRSFGSRHALHNHLNDSSRHAWCSRCKVLLPSDEAMLSHRAESQQHWICDDCRLDFLTEADRLKHYETSPKHHLCQGYGENCSAAAEPSQVSQMIRPTASKRH